MFKKYVRKSGLSLFLGAVPFLLFFVFCFVASVKAEQGLVGWWKFDEGVSDILHDSSGNGNDGKIYGAKWVKGKTGSALLFDGKDDYVDCLDIDSTQLQGPLTISTWVNISASNNKTNNGYFISRHDWNIGIGDSFIPFFEFWNSTGTKRVILSAERKIQTDEWVHLVAVYSIKNEVIEFYINGEKTNYERYSEGGISGVFYWRLMFGRESLMGPGFSFKGALDEIRIYDRALSSEEIRNNYENQGGTKSLLVYPLKISFLKITPLYGQKKLVIDLDIKPLSENIELKEVELDIILLDDLKVIENRRLNVNTKSQKYQIVFNMKDAGSSVYRIKGIIKDENGRELSTEAAKDFSWLTKELEKFTWINSKEGITDEVLAPWTPIEVEKKDKGLIVKVWGRAYHFENSIFPTKIETKGTSILAGPIQAIAKVNGENVSWKLSEVKIEKQSPSLICFTREATGKGLIISGKTQIEYDGVIRIDWKVNSKQNLKLEELTFEIPIKEKHAKYIYTKDYQGIVGFIPKDGWRTSFIPEIWLGDEDLGLEWFCESKVDWYNVKPTKCIEVLSKGDIVKLRLRLIDKTITMKPGVRPEHELGIPVMQPIDNVNELSYTFGLQATPVKPIEKDVWDYRFFHLGQGSLDTSIAVGSGERFNISESILDSLVRDGVKTMAIHEHWTDSFCSTSTSHEKELKKLVKNCHDRGIQILLYFGMAMPDNIPEYPLFNEEFVLLPLNVWNVTWKPMPVHNAPNVCLRSMWQDYLVDGLAKTMIEKYDIDGVYLDSTNCTWGGCKNVLHGCGYIGLDGNVKKTYALFSHRQTFKRFYTVIKQHKSDGQVNSHNSTEMSASTLSWTTSYWNGEHLGVLMMVKGISKTDPILKKMPLDYFRTEFMGVQWGVAAEFLEYTFTDDCWQETLALSLLHDVPIRVHHLMSPIWKLFDEFGRKESEWLPYWRNKEYVSIKPEGGVRLSSAEVKDVYVSLYKHLKNGVLAVVSNLGESDVPKVEVQLNLEKLKLKDKQKLFTHMMTIVKDRGVVIDEPKPINIDDGTFDLSLPSNGWKIIWIKQEK